MDIKVFDFNPFHEHCFVASGDTGQCVVIDPGCASSTERERLLAYLNGEGLHPQAVLLTHGHFDHIYGVKWLQDLYGIPVYMKAEDKPIIEPIIARAVAMGMEAPDSSFTTTDMEDGQVLSIAGMEFTVITTPGHTPGGVCFLEKNSKVMFTGDTLFCGSIGRSDLDGGDYDSLILSVMNKLIGLDAGIDILPGHGGSSNIGRERTSNPFLEPFNEPDQDYNV